MHISAPAFVALMAAALTLAAPTEPNPSHRKTSLEDGKKDLSGKGKGNSNWKKHEKILHFDATYIVKATPEQVINTTQTPAPGQPGAKGLFKYAINVAENTICYNITLSGITGPYQSAALTATHIHEAPEGRAGPPRIALPNPAGPDGRRVSAGCIAGPFETGIDGADGVDTGVGFHVRQIVENPGGFFTDTHTRAYVPGAVRGQLG